MATVAAATDTQTLDRDFATMVDAYVQSVKENAYNSHAALRALMSAPGVKEGHNGGKRVHVPLELAAPDTADAVAEFGSFNTDPTHTRTAALYPIARYLKSITVERVDMLLHRSPEAIAPILQLETDVARRDLEKRINLDISDDGAANAERIVGLEEICTEAPTLGTLGGVSRVTNASYRNINVTNAALANLVADMENAYTSIEDGAEMANLIFTSRTGRRRYISQLTATIRIDPMEMAKGGPADGTVRNLQFGGAPVVVDADFQTWGGGTGIVFAFLNTKHIHFRVVEEFGTVPFVRPSTEDTHKGALRWVGALYCSAPKWQSLVSDVQAS